MVISSKPVVAGAHFREASGMLRLNFHSGAVVAVEAPADFRVESAMQLALASGRVNVWCPESAHGFQVRTDSAVLTDLGTSFGVQTDGNGKAECVVMDGLVEVAKGAQKVRLAEGNAIEANEGEAIRTVAFEPSSFAKTWALSFGILSTRGAVVAADPDTPGKVEPCGGQRECPGDS